MVEQEQAQTIPTQMEWSKNVLLISARRRSRFWMWQAKTKLKEMNSVELHGLGDSMSLVVSVAESLARLGYVSISKIQTLTADVQTRNQEQVKRAKLIITIEKTANFDKLFNEYEKSNANVDFLKENQGNA